MNCKANDNLKEAVQQYNKSNYTITYLRLTIASLNERRVIMERYAYETKRNLWEIIERILKCLIIQKAKLFKGSKQILQ